MDTAERITGKFKNVRERLNLKQNDVVKDIKNMIESGEIVLKRKNEEITFSQSILSYIENNFSGASKEKMYLLVEYYERKHGINPAYYFSYSEHEPMFNQDKFLDITGEKINKAKINKIVEKYETRFNKLKEDIIDEILKEMI